MVPYAPYPNVELQAVPYAHHHPHHGGAAYGGAGPFGGGDGPMGMLQSRAKVEVEPETGADAA